MDKALGEVSSAQAKLGAVQNRLQHNIDNLSKSSMLSEQAVGRVIDSDFASETSNLSRQQILNQAATAMLAQANQSKQTVLSLCNKLLSRLFEVTLLFFEAKKINYISPKKNLCGRLFCYGWVLEIMQRKKLPKH